MGTIDEIKSMQAQGRSEGEIRNVLKQRGLSEREIENVVNQAKIKEAVAQGYSTKQNVPQPSGMPEIPSATKESDYPQDYSAQNYGDMQPSMMGQPQQVQEYGGGAYEAEDSGGQQYGYDQYQPYQEAMSSDMIREISEQVVSERLSVLQDKLEAALHFKSVAEARIASIDERLKRIEEIIDRLQLSLLQKVGDYVNDVRDIKHELIETQKSFKKLAPEMRGHHKGKP